MIRDDMADDVELRMFPFRGGPADGKQLRVPVTHNREWPIPTLDGRWVGEPGVTLPADMTESDYRHENYLRVGDEYVHSSLVTADDDPPKHWLRGAS